MASPEKKTGPGTFAQKAPVSTRRSRHTSALQTSNQSEAQPWGANGTGKKRGVFKQEKNNPTNPTESGLCLEVSTKRRERGEKREGIKLTNENGRFL